MKNNNKPKTKYTAQEPLVPGDLSLCAVIETELVLSRRKAVSTDLGPATTARWCYRSGRRQTVAVELLFVKLEESFFNRHRAPDDLCGQSGAYYLRCALWSPLGVNGITLSSRVPSTAAEVSCTFA